MPKEPTIAKPLAPQDLTESDHVAVLSIITEHLTFADLCGDEPWRRARGVVRTRWLPCRDIGTPLRIVQVCLPFVLVEQPDGTCKTPDVRRMQFARLSETLAKKARNRHAGG